MFLGTGNGTTVLELVNTMNDVLIKNGLNKINYQIGKRRQGDLDVSYAKVDKIYKELGFKTNKTITEMCESGLKYYFK